jgi:hypothetical protein
MRDKIRCIVQGMELYFRTFALADNICLHETDIEWICPKPDSVGPSIVFKVSLDEKTARTRLVELAPDLRAGVIPSWWVLSPLSTPPNILKYLRAIGFEGQVDSNSIIFPHEKGWKVTGCALVRTSCLVGRISS